MWGYCCLSIYSHTHSRVGLHFLFLLSVLDIIHCVTVPHCRRSLLTVHFSVSKINSELGFGTCWGIGGSMPVWGWRACLCVSGWVLIKSIDVERPLPNYGWDLGYLSGKNLAEQWMLMAIALYPWVQMWCDKLPPASMTHKHPLTLTWSSKLK